MCGVCLCMYYNQYFLDYGLAVAQVEGRVVNTFIAGDFFGEVAFIATAACLMEGDKAGSTTRRTATVAARGTFCKFQRWGTAHSHSLQTHCRCEY